MADYIYLLETRLSAAQRAAISAVRDVAREHGVTVFLVGGAVRDLISGSAVRDLDVAIQGDVLGLRGALETAGAEISGEYEAGQALFVRFPGSVRMEVGSTLSITYPQPGKPVAESAAILDDLRRRDFTANAMALSLNEGSYGLLMDPLNGVADIEERQFRLVSNYGFIEDPVRMIRAARLIGRLGWHLEEKTQARYDAGKEEGYISALDEFHRAYETEELFHEEDPIRVMRRMEEEGWMKVLDPALSVAKANVAELERLRESQTQMQLHGVHADTGSANFPLLTARLSPGEVAALKGSFPRKGFVREIETLDEQSKAFLGQLSAKSSALPSQTYKLIAAGKPEAVLWAAHTGKSAVVQGRFKSFVNDWTQARQRIPYILMQEMRITAELPNYNELLDNLTYALMDGKLQTPEETKAFLEPFSPPAPPPPVNLRKQRASKKETKVKGRKKAAVAEAEEPQSGTGEAAEETSAEPAAAVSAAPAAGQMKGGEPKEAPGPVLVKKIPQTRPATEPTSAPVKAVAKVAGPVPVKGVHAVAKKAAPTAALPAAKKSAPPVKAVAQTKTASPTKAAVPVKTVAPAKSATASKTGPAKTSGGRAVPSKVVAKAAAKPAKAKKKAPAKAAPSTKPAAKKAPKALAAKKRPAASPPAKAKKSPAKSKPVAKKGR